MPIRIIRNIAQTYTNWKSALMSSEKCTTHSQDPAHHQFLMQWVFMHIALKGCRPLHTNEPVQFWIGFGLVLIGGSGLNPLGLLGPSLDNPASD